MKHSIHNETIDFLGKHKSDEIVNYFSGADELEIIIFEEGLRIKHVYIDKELDLIALVLNNKKIIKRKVSEFPQLMTASNHDLLLFENDGVGIHWPQIDFDLSLKGFLRYELAHIDKPFSV
jgi:Protein of unknown function (DUF2442)